jgi:MFS family permease
VNEKKNKDNKDNNALKVPIDQDQNRDLKELREQKKWNWNIRKVYLFQFLINFHLIGGVLVPFFTDWGQLTFFEVMCLESYFTVMILVFEIPCGAISDYTSRKFSLILAGIANAIAVIIYSSYPHIIFFGIGETLWAFSVALISGTEQALIHDSLKKVKKTHIMNRKMATLQTALLIGIGLSAPIGSMIGEYISLPFVMFIMVVPFSLATLIGLIIREPNDSIKHLKQKSYDELIVSGFNVLKEKKNLRILGFEYFSLEMIAIFLIWMYQPYLEQLNISLAFFGFISAGMTISQVAFTILVPKLEKHTRNRRRLIRGYTVIPGIAFTLMGIINIPYISIILIFLVVGFGFSRKIFFNEAINNLIESEERATILSTINMFGSLLRAIFYPIMGYFVMWNLNYTFIILGIIVLLDAALMRIKNEYF